MAAAGIAINISMGAMKPVLEKLAMLLGDKYKKLKDLRKEVSFLVKELGEMKALLEKMDDVADELDPQAKNWRKDIIDMSYDIEDCIDNFMDCVGDVDDKMGILKKASHYLRTIKDRYHIANQINEIKTRVIEASKRRDRYNLNVCTSSSTAKVEVDPRLSALYKDSTTLVGIDALKEHFVKWVDDEEKQLKLISIVGFGGLGKTTLANEVYRDVKGHFSSKAFVPVSQKPDVPRLLSTVCSKLGLSPSSHACEELIDTLRAYLHDKRYLIVLDDLWEKKHWNIISCAFPKNSQRSRLIVTTRIEDVARACCIDHGCIHYMKPLSEVDSRRLFFRRIFGTEDTCPPQFTEVSSEILKKCGGLPLAIVTMASTLACQPVQQWEYIQRSIVTESAANSLDDMMHILDLSYKHLPHHLRACFLYLGIYPEDYTIKRDELISLWVAERIVMSKSPGQDVKDIAESYFNELVNRNMMIQLESDHGYKVHDVMLDLIIKRCKEDNFVSVVHSGQVAVERQDRVHRLSVRLSRAADDDNILQVATNCCRSQVRSLVSFGAEWMPPLLKLKSLRVLYLAYVRYDVDLTVIGQLSQLRYLRFGREPQFFYAGRAHVLPSEIWRLRHLERLEIQCIPIRITPLDIIGMPCLSHLILPKNTRLPDGIGKLKSLRTLKYFRLEVSSPENIKGLGELSNLEELCLNFPYASTIVDTSTSIWMDALIFSLQKLSNLKCFFLTYNIYDSFEVTCADPLMLLSPPFHNLEILNLDGLTFSRVPRWIQDLPKLHRLTLGAKQMSHEDIAVIGTLPSLLKLYLRIPGVPTDRVVIGGSMGFTALEYFEFDCDATSYLTFEGGAMPSIREICLVLITHEWDKATPLGLQYLLSLEKITVCTVQNDDDSFDKDPTTDVEDLEETALISTVFQEAADAHPSHPAFTFHEGSKFRPTAKEEAQD